MRGSKPMNDQQAHGENTFRKTPEMFGEEPSDPARRAADLFRQEGAVNILELGAGQGRDTIFFARQGFRVHALDYSEAGLKTFSQKAELSGFSPSVKVLRHDVRLALPFEDGSFDACYSHMLFCMALVPEALEFLAQEIRRILKPGGLHIYTVRHTGDSHHGRGIHRGDGMYEMNGFVVRFFSREKVNELAKGYEILGVDEFEEGPLPRKLFRVTLRKKGAG